MIISVDLHLRSSPLHVHRNLGATAVELEGSRLAPDEEITCEIDGRLVRAHITAIRRRPDCLAHVYADEVTADAMA